MINTSNLSVSQEFDAVEFELKHSRDFQILQNAYINYEVDSIEDDFGELFRVWNGRTLVGLFYEKAQNRWTANPYYKDGQLIGLDRDLSRTFGSSSQAVAYIQATYKKQVAVAA